MKKLSNQEIEINTLLIQKRYKVNVTYLGFDHKKDMDSWMFEFSNENWPKSKTVRFFYYSGIGHRFIKQSNFKYPKLCYSVTHVTKHDLKLIQDHCKKYNRLNTSINTSVMKPEIAGLLYSLILDSEAMHESFINWCANFGYDNDSISNLNLYQECCKVGKEFYSFFPKDTIEEFKKILEDY